MTSSFATGDDGAPERAPRETVIVVHGTFSGKIPEGEPGWYAPGQTFGRELDAALETRGCGARCWKHLRPGEDYFWWDGANDWLSRYNATVRLRRELRRLRDLGWTTHLVGHSHGGNVIIDAITNDAGRIEPWFRGRVTLLGTPLYRHASTFERRQRNTTLGWAVASVLAWALLLYLSAREVDPPAAFARGAATDSWATAVVGIVTIAAAVLLFRSVRWLVRNTRSIGMMTFTLKVQGPSLKQGEWRRSPALMLINSHFDEAYRSLAGLQEGDNPLLSKAREEPPRTFGARLARRLTWPLRVLGSLATHLMAVLRIGRQRLAARIGRTLHTDRIGASLVLGAALVLLVLLWRNAMALAGAVSAPMLALAFWTLLCVLVVTACLFDRFVFLPGIVLLEGPVAIWRALTGLAALQFAVPIRRAVWGFMRSLGLGLSGAPQRVEDTRVTRDSVDPEDCVYLELPEDVVSEVKATQHGRLGEVQEILYRRGGIWSATHLQQELQAVKFPLVHTVYYRNSECIQKIADWTCEPMVEEFDGRRKLQTMRMAGAAIGGMQGGYLEEIEGVNAYRKHLDDLKQKHAPPGSRWGSATRLSFEAVVAQGVPSVPKLPGRWRVPPPGMKVNPPSGGDS